MIAPLRLGDAEAQQHLVEERRIGKAHAERAKIVAGMEHQLVDARRHRAAVAERRVAAPIIVRHARREQPALAGSGIKLDLHARGGPSLGRVEHMRGQPCHRIRPSARRAIADRTGLLRPARQYCRESAPGGKSYRILTRIAYDLTRRKSASRRPVGPGMRPRRSTQAACQRARSRRQMPVSFGATGGRARGRRHVRHRRLRALEGVDGKYEASHPRVMVVGDIRLDAPLPIANASCARSAARPTSSSPISSRRCSAGAIGRRASAGGAGVLGADGYSTTTTSPISAARPARRSPPGRGRIRCMPGCCATCCATPSRAMSSSGARPIGTR